MAENFRALRSFTDGRLDSHYPYRVSGKQSGLSHLPAMADQSGCSLCDPPRAKGLTHRHPPQGNRVKPIKSFLRTAITLWVMSARRSVLLSESRLKNRST